MSEKSGADWDSAATDERVEGILAQLSLEEKVAFVTGDLNWNFGFFAEGVQRLGVPDIQMADGPAGVRINKGDVHGGKATSLPAPIALAAIREIERPTTPMSKPLISTKFSRK